METPSGSPGKGGKDSSSSNGVHSGVAKRSFFGESRSFVNKTALTASSGDVRAEVPATGSITRAQIEEKLLASGIAPSREDLKSSLYSIFDEKESVPVAALEENSLLLRAFMGQLVVPNFSDFCATLSDIYTQTSSNSSGQVAAYIPNLAAANPDRFAFSICTVDGQVYSHGDSDFPCSIQSCVKPLIYALTCEELGLEEVHRYVGVSPSGFKFNDISLNREGKPHNPFINAGAMAVCSQFQRKLSPSTRFRFLLDSITKLAGGQKVGFDQATYLGEIETAWANQAIIQYMQYMKAFPEGTHVDNVLDFYIQTCALEVNCRSLSVIAATLANGGVCPTTQQAVLSPFTVRGTLNIMLSCGMYDYSGECLVIPNVLGLAVYSAPLDKHGNSSRGVELCRRLIDRYQYSIFDQMIQCAAGRRRFEVESLEDRCLLLPSEDDSSQAKDVPVELIYDKLNSAGIAVDTPVVKGILQQLTGNTLKNSVSVLDIFAGSEDHIVAKTLSSRLAVPVFREFCEDVKVFYEELIQHTAGTLHVDSERYKSMHHAAKQSPELFGVSVCTVDGQCFSIGDAHEEFPIFGCVLPLLYGIVCTEVGTEEVHKVIGKEPAAVDPHGFALNEGKPFNPFMDSAALIMAARLLHDSPNRGSKFTQLVRILTEFAGDMRLSYSQPAYLDQKHNAHMLKAVSSAMKGRGLYPPGVSPVHAAELLFQLFSIEVTAASMARMAATFANGGVCPTSDKSCISPEVLKSVLSVTYGCGMQRASGQWNFEVNLPATFGISGGLLVVVPNVMGVAIYSPRVDSSGLCSRGFEFCKRLGHKYRLSIFDQLVYGQKHFIIPEIKRKTQTPDELESLNFELMNASADGKLEAVRRLVSGGAQVNYSDYDSRTPLHLASAGGFLEVVLFLLSEGADPTHADKWGSLPANEAKEHPEIVQALADHTSSK